jgi:hypothetical protein
MYGYGMLTLTSAGVVIDWFTIRPIDDITKEQLAPEEFEKHQKTYYFNPLSCFCAILDEHAESAKAEFLVDPEYGWIVQCTKNRCGYTG